MDSLLTLLSPAGNNYTVANTLVVGEELGKLFYFS